jgi:hypothetical protein
MKKERKKGKQRGREEKRKKHGEIDVKLKV